MPRLVADDISLSFPVFGRSAGGGKAEIVGDEGRLVTRSDGSIKAVRALRSVSLSLKSGDRVGLIGRNGSGKTTLLRVLAGILPPDEGTVTIEGRATNLININLGMQSQASGHENIRLRGLAAGATRREIEARRPNIEAFCELGSFLDLPVQTYSAGMRMRLNFAIATAFEPEILILDEWLSAGDETFKRKVAERMKTFVDRAAILVLASHSRKLLLDNCEKILWIDQGRLKTFGPAEEVLKVYAEDMANDAA